MSQDPKRAETSTAAIRRHGTCFVGGRLVARETRKRVAPEDSAWSSSQSLWSLHRVTSSVPMRDEMYGTIVAHRTVG